MLKIIGIFFLVCLCIYFLPFILPVVLIITIYIECYYRSKKFNELKESIKDYTKDCNELNEHIEELKNTYKNNFRSSNLGTTTYSNTSNYNYKKPFMKNIQQATEVCDCSLTVCRNAQREPFKYFCKYFHVPENEETLNIFEETLNDFSSAEQGKELLKKQEEEIVATISNKIPFLVKTLNPNRLYQKLGFTPIDLSQMYFPKYTFQYVSAGGNSSNKVDLLFDINNLNDFVTYLSEKIKFKKSVKGQRALMTTALREKIKQRDNFTCKKCGISTEKEPHLLLEIDHIVPLAKGGITSEENLQTLCWRCNRTKGSKLEEEQKITEN